MGTTLQADDLAPLRQVLRPISDVGVLAQDGAALAFSQASPHAEFDLVVEGVSTTFHLDGAAAADRCGFALLGTADEECVGVAGAADRHGDPLATFEGPLGVYGGALSYLLPKS